MDFQAKPKTLLSLCNTSLLLILRNPMFRNLKRYQKGTSWKDWGQYSHPYLESEGDCFEVNDKGLLMATKLGHLDLIHWILDFGIDVNSKFSRKLCFKKCETRTALMVAAESGQKGAIKEILSLNGAESLNTVGMDGKSALLLAFEKGNGDICNLLLSIGARIQIAEFNAVSKVYLEARDKALRRNKQFFQQFLNSLPSLDLTNIEGLNLLMLAVIQSDEENVETLICAGANLDIQCPSAPPASGFSRYFRNASHPPHEFGGFTPLLIATSNGDLSIIKRLVEAGATDSPSLSAIYLACEKGAQDCIEFLLQPSYKYKPGINCIVETRGHTTALQMAAKSNCTEMIRLLLTKGAKVDFPSAQMSPLMYAISNDNREAVYLLLHAGADPSISSWRGKSALTLARSLQNKTLLNLLKKAQKNHNKQCSGLKGDSVARNPAKTNKLKPQNNSSNSKVLETSCAQCSKEYSNTGKTDFRMCNDCKRQVHRGSCWKTHNSGKSTTCWK